VCKFLRSRFGTRPLEITRLTPRDLLAFIMRQAKHCEPGTAHVLGCALRSYLRFRAFHGDRTEALIAAIPRVAQWPQSRLPQHLTADELARFLDAFDQRTISGQRGYAIARCLLDLGLRASEVARIELDDLNWYEGTLRIRTTKSRRVDLLPLPVPTGQAIVQYLRHARAQRAGRALFVRHRAPIDAPVSTEIVRNTVRLAFARCGLSARYSGTHVLRHTAATRWLAAGASLKDIADLLRHRCLDTSMIYAKVDLAKLAAMAAPWPGSAP
jgi:integrase/recombinase XerD